MKDNHQFPEEMRMVRLWQMVVVQALMDASGNCEGLAERHYKDEATRWLSGENKDFFMVCDFANLNPYSTREKAKKAIEKGVKMRAGLGTSPDYLQRRSYYKQYRERRKQNREIERQTILSLIVNTSYTHQLIDV